MAKKTPAVKNSKTGTAKKTKLNQAAKAVSKVRVSLVNELRAIIPKLDSEGLAFLVKQARIHLYNMKVTELNKAAQVVNSIRSDSVQAKAKKDDFDIKPTTAGFYLRYQNNGTMFSKPEMIQLVKIINGQGTAPEITERLFNWLEKERKDIFRLIPVKDKSDNRLKILASLIKKNFKLKK
jgi:hypothetical protein